MTAPARFDASHPASARQRAAANPLASTWLSANAGSGKTRVLTDRVARLLLAGADPQTVLCLTYTKAAAAEMQNRLFARLGTWAMMPDGALRAELTALGLEDALEDADLRQARTLFAQAIETPGGLKIQTIHAFCASLLRRFPLEAGVSPDFRELDDRAAKLLRAEVAEEMATGPLAPLVDAVASQVSGDGWDNLLQEVAGCRDAFGGPCPEDELRAHLGLPSEATEERLLLCLAGDAPRRLLHELRGHCAAGSVTDQKAAEALAEACAHDPFTLDTLALLEGVLLTGEKAAEPFAPKLGKFPTAATRKKAAHLCDALDALMEAVAEAREARLALKVLARSRALHDFATAFAGSYETKKLQRGALDFDDLIARARALLSDPAVAQWVLWRLDGGLDHILVDEAQDTSPQQWAVIERLASEFAAGEGARPRARTIFVVGDRKQSIYSFQGADAASFERMRAHFEGEVGRIGGRLAQESLEYSFRSAETVLRVVDATFEGPASHAGLGEAPPRHLAFKAGMPGRVDLWPPVPKEEAPEEERAWHDPVDRVSPKDEKLLLARRVAEAAEGMLRDGTLPVQDGDGWARRPVTPGDILILVRTRTGPLFTGIIRELKARGLEVAGADRMRLKAELAVRDVEAVLKVLALPQDCLSLACALKSPLFGWSEARLFALAHPRPEGQTLWEALDRRPDAHPDAAARDAFRDLRRHADFLRPFELASRLLLRHDGRRKLLARLGPEAEDGIDALLHQALLYEADAVPSLTGFLEWRATAEAEVKRQLDGGGDRIRVMTVHGAKGLEAPVVILPDCAKATARSGGGGPLLVPVDGDSGRRMLWRASKAEAPGALRRAQEARAEGERRERQRLLYVAMTRAESWLVVAAAGETGAAGESWHADVEAGLRAVGAPEHDFPWGRGLRAGGDWDHLPLRARAGAARAEGEGAGAAADLGPAPPPPAREAPLSPSDLGGAPAPDDDDADAARARARGALLHLALEHLAVAGPEGTADLLAATEEAALVADLGAVVAEAGALLAAPGLAPVLGPPPPGWSALSEVTVAGEVPGLGPLRGVADRLVVGPDEVRVVDFKSHRAVPHLPEETPEAVLRQMGAYVAILEGVYPGRRVVPLVLWTHEARPMELPRALVMAALQRAVAERAPTP